MMGNEVVRRPVVGLCVSTHAGLRTVSPPATFVRGKRMDQQVEIHDARASDQGADAENGERDAAGESRPRARLDVDRHLRTADRERLRRTDAGAADAVRAVRWKGAIARRRARRRPAPIGVLAFDEASVMAAVFI
jgi:hypothetical protein